MILHSLYLPIIRENYRRMKHKENEDKVLKLINYFMENKDKLSEKDKIALLQFTDGLSKQYNV